MSMLNLNIIKCFCFCVSSLNSLQEEEEMDNNVSESLPERTFQYQSSLPPLPVPPLEKSLSKYLDAGRIVTLNNRKCNKFCLRSCKPFSFSSPSFFLPSIDDVSPFLFLTNWLADWSKTENHHPILLISVQSQPPP